MKVSFNNVLKKRKRQADNLKKKGFFKSNVKIGKNEKKLENLEKSEKQEKGKKDKNCEFLENESLDYSKRKIRSNLVKNVSIKECVDTNKEIKEKRIRSGASLKKDVDFIENNDKKRKVEVLKDDKNNKKSKIKKLSRKIVINNIKSTPKSYYLLLICMIVLAVISIKLAINSHSSLYEESYEVFNNYDNTVNTDNETEGNNLNVEPITNSLSSIKELNENKTSTNTNTETKKTKVNTVAVKIEPLVFIKPLNGTIQKIFSSDKVIYSKTLDMWKTHDGIDISGNLTDDVFSIEKGIVTKVYNDSFLGTTVVIDHSQGYVSIYSNLQNVCVKEKQVLTKGQTIGEVGKTSIGEYCDDPHLHFQLMFNGNIIDPSYIY